jgi:hypothetical protein
MRVRTFAVVSFLVLATGCNLLKKKDDEGGVASTAPTTSATSGGIVAKGLSFIGAAAFQGQVDMIIKNEKGGGHGSILVKGPKQRMEFTSPEAKVGAIIMDGEAKKMIMLDDAKKTAMVMTLKDPGAAPPAGPPGTHPTAPPPKEHDFKRTGKKDVVAGYDCEIWTYEEPDQKGELCVADGFSLLGFGGLSLGALSGKISGMPLRAISQTKDGKEKDRWEVTKIERRDVPDDKFQVPPGYQTMDMDQLMKGLGGFGAPTARPKH